MLKVARQIDGTAEIFYSVQGEGINTGKPAVFLRLALCNLACSWCDTKYTWNWQAKDEQQNVVELSAEEILEEIKKFPCRFLVITGGEPLLQQKELAPLINRLLQYGFSFEIESNGTLLPLPDTAQLVDHWSISPKLKNSGNRLPSREKPACYQYFNDLTNSHFKFVIDKEDDFAEVQLIAEKYAIKPEKIILMPQAIEREILLEKSRWLVERCKKEGYLFSIRLQILLWGNKRGI